MGSVKQPLRVTVVGAGLGGLAAAIALRNAGHHVLVYEKYPYADNGKILSPGGNVIAFGTHLTRLLVSWGFDLKKAGATPILAERSFNAETLELVQQLDFEYTKEETGHDWLAASRPALHSGLLDVARESPVGVGRIEIHAGQAVVDLDCDAATITLEDKTKVTSDLVIVADGIHSKLIDSVTKNTTPPMKPGRTAYWFEIPARKVYEDPLLKPVFETHKPGFTTFRNLKTGVYFILLDADNAETFYGILLHPSITEREGSTQKWDVKGSREELEKLAKAFHPAIRRVCELAENLLLWTITCRDPLSAIVNGRAVAIGDAVHPHLPHHGQGAASAAQDAASLAVFFSGDNAMNQQDIPKILRQWEAFRLPRANTIQLITMTFPTPIEALQERIRREFGYKGSLPENVISHEKPVNMWLFKYDIVKEAQAYLKSLSST